MDLYQLWWVSWIRAGSLQGVFAAVVRRSQSFERRLLGNTVGNDSQRLSQLLYARPPRRVGRLSHLRCLNLSERLKSCSPANENRYYHTRNARIAFRQSSHSCSM